jgi:hypothetical protein
MFLCVPCCSSQELWPSLIEKAYARLHGGYAAIATGSVADALVDLTGGVVSKISLSDEAHMQDAATGEGMCRCHHIFPCLLLYKASAALANTAVHTLLLAAAAEVLGRVVVVLVSSGVAKTCLTAHQLNILCALLQAAYGHPLSSGWRLAAS